LNVHKIKFGGNFATVDFSEKGVSVANINQRKYGKWQARIRRIGQPDSSKTFQTQEAAQQGSRAAHREMDKAMAQ